MNAPAWICALSLLFLAGGAAAQPLTRTLTDAKSPDVVGTQRTTGGNLGAFLQTLDAECGDAEVLIQSAGNVISRLRFDQKRLEMRDDSGGTPSIDIEIPGTGYVGSLADAPKKCRLETETRPKNAKAKARLDCKLGKNGAALEPPPSADDAAEAAAACKGEKRVSIDKNLSRIKISLSGTFE